MSESTVEVPAGEPAEATRPLRRGRMAAWVSAGIVAALVITGAIAVPRIVHAQRVGEYAELVAERDTALADRAEAQSQLRAAIALTQARHAEATALAQRAMALGETPEPILAAAHAQALTDSGNGLTAAIGETLEVAEVDANAHAALTAAVAAARDADAAARAEAEEAGEDAPEPVAPASYLGLDVDGARAVLASDQAVSTVTTVPDAEVSEQVLEAAASHIAQIRAETAAFEDRLADEQERMTAFADAVTAAVPALQGVAEGAAGQASQVAEQTPKAPDAAAVAVSAAQRAGEAATADDVTAMLDTLAAYVDSAKAAQVEHEAVVQREREEAEARARAEAEAARQAQSARGGGGGSSGGGGGSGGSGKRLKLCVRYSGGTLGFTYC